MARRVQRRRRGFSILELSVVLATVSVLSTIAIPKFINSFKRARAVEAMQTLATIERFTKEYYNRNGEYPRVSGGRNPPDLGYNKAQMVDSLPGWAELGFKPESSYRFRYLFTTTPDPVSGKYTRLTLEAMADTDNDGNIGHFIRQYEDGTDVTDPLLDTAD